MTALPAPSLIIRQSFGGQVSATSQPLRAFLMGGNAFCRRYSVPSEKAVAGLGVYDNVGTLVGGQMQSIYSWPGRPAGSTVDADFTRVFCDGALLRYYHNTAHNILRVTGYRNRIRLSTAVFSTGNGVSTTVGDRGVKIGDPVLVKGLDTSDAPFSLSSVVLGFVGDPIAAVIGSVVRASSNVAATTAAAVIVAGSGNSTNLAVSVGANAGGYVGLTSGFIQESYTVTVVTGGVPASARLRVVSASGTDDQTSVTPSALGSTTAIGTRGLQVTFSQDDLQVFAVGDSWTFTVTQATTLSSLAVGGSYTDTRDRVYIIEVVRGGLLASGPSPQIRVRSQDGTDTGPVISVGASAFALGSFGLTGTFTSTTGLIYGDKYTVAVTAKKEGAQRTIVLAHDLPANVADDTTAELEVDIFIKDDIEIPRQSITPGSYNWTPEATQLRLAAGIQVYHDEWTSGGVAAALPIVTSSFFGTNRLYVQYRAWYPQSTDIIGVGPNDDLDAIVLGPTDPDNPLKYALSLAQGSAGGETIYIFNVGDPTINTGWLAALRKAATNKLAYGHVPLTLDPDIIQLCSAHVRQFGSGISKQFYRSLWVGSNEFTVGEVVGPTTSTNAQVVLATAEDGPDTGTQYTLIRLSGSNADFLAMGVRPGDEVRYLYEVDAWGNETYLSRKVDQVLSATTLLVDSSIGSVQAVAKRMEIHRTYTASDLVDLYSQEAGSHSSDLIRYVLAPRIVVGSYELPSYYAAAILAGMRSAAVPQQSLSTYAVSGVFNVLGLDQFSESDLDELAGAGCAIIYYDYETNDVRIRHMITTEPDQEILVKREESCVACRHVALFELAAALRPYVARVNLSSDLEAVQGRIFAEISSVNRRLQVLYETEALGGVIVDITNINISVPAGMQDRLAIGLTFEIGKPGNYLEVNSLII